MDVDDLFLEDEPDVGVATSVENRVPQPASDGGSTRSTNLASFLDFPFDGATADEDDDEVEMTAEEVMSQLKTAWINERFAPDLLDSRHEVVTCLLHQITSMGSKLQRVASAVRGDADQVRVEIHQMEMQRIRYLVSSYLRIRLNKIERHLFYHLKEYRSQPPHNYSKMSPEELQFALKLEQLYKGQLQTQVLNKLPNGVDKLDEQLLAVEPNLNHYVFLKVNQSQRQVLIDENDPEGVVDLNEGTQYLVKYKTIAPLVQNDSLSLI